MSTWTDLHAPKPGDLIYSRDPDGGEVHTGKAWVVLENDGPVPAERLGAEMPWKTYWSVWVQCDDGIAGRCEYGDNPTHTEHCFLLAADDFVPVSALPNFTVVR
jgi:hypothetical protein